MSTRDSARRAGAADARTSRTVTAGVEVEPEGEAGGEEGAQQEAGEGAQQEAMQLS